MTATVELPWVVADKSEASLPKSAAGRLIQLAESAGFPSQAALARAMKVAPKTVERAANGQGSQKFGRQLREFLVKRGVKEAAAVLLDPNAPAIESEPALVTFSIEEWERMRDLIGRYAPKHLELMDDVETICAQLRAIAAACETLDRDLTKMTRATK